MSYELRVTSLVALPQRTREVLEATNYELNFIKI